jgi:hypothetical protein
MRGLPRLTGHLGVLSGTLLLFASTAWAHKASPAPPPRAILTGVRPYVPHLAIGTTDPNVVYAVPKVQRPSYLMSAIDPTFRTQVMRITGTTDTPTHSVTGTWGSDARHVYSKQEPWNADQSLISVENREGGTPSVVILDGTTYEPRYAPCGNYDFYDYRWHPTRAHSTEQINVNSAGTELMWFDVTTCTKTRSWTLPITVDYGIGSGEGNASQDGRYVALCDGTRMFVVDMDPQPPFAPYPSKRIGPVYTIPPCNLDASDPSRCVVDNISISPLGNYIDVDYDGLTGITEDAHRIFEVDPATLSIKVHMMDPNALRCGSDFASRNDGWIFPTKHADMAVDPFDNNAEVMIGGRSCSESNIGHVVKIRLSDGRVTPLTDPTNEAYVQHVSARNLDLPGWAFVGFEPEYGMRFADEIVAVKLDGSQSVQRIAHKHSLTTNCYRCESHAVPSPDGQRVIFASNWAEDCLSCGPTSDIKDFVVWKPAGTTELIVAAPPPDHVGLSLASASPNPATSRVAISYTLADEGPAHLAMIDARGREVWGRDLAEEAGPHAIDLERDRHWAAGVYWLRLTQARHQAERKVTLLE